MKSNRIIWGLVSLVVLTTLAISLGTMSGHSQQDASKEQDDKGYDHLSKFAFTDYDAPESGNAKEREERKLKNSRYDNQDWVLKNPHPKDGGVGRYDDDGTPPPPLFPADESDLVVVGKITNARAHLSNDKLGVYTEFTIRVEQVLKADASKKIEPGDFVTADRAGGGVRYPNGQKVVYEHSEHGLLFAGDEYLLFLTSGGNNPNYKILQAYEMKESKVKQLDTGRRFDEFKEMGKQKFIEAVRNKIQSRRQP